MDQLPLPMPSVPESFKLENNINNQHFFQVYEGLRTHSFSYNNSRGGFKLCATSNESKVDVVAPPTLHFVSDMIPLALEVATITILNQVHRGAQQTPKIEI